MVRTAGDVDVDDGDAEKIAMPGAADSEVLVVLADGDDAGAAREMDDDDDDVEDDGGPVMPVAVPVGDGGVVDLMRVDEVAVAADPVTAGADAADLVRADADDVGLVRVGADLVKAGVGSGLEMAGADIVDLVRADVGDPEMADEGGVVDLVKVVVGEVDHVSAVQVDLVYVGDGAGDLVVAGGILVSCQNQ